MFRVGRDVLQQMVGESRVFGFVNWTMLPHLSDIWKQLLATGFLKQGGVRRIFMVDLCDPEKRPSKDILEAMQILTAAQEQADVVLGLNLKESTTIAEVIGIPVQGEPEPQIERTAANIRKKLNLSCVVVHPRAAPQPRLPTAAQALPARLSNNPESAPARAIISMPVSAWAECWDSAWRKACAQVLPPAAIMYARPSARPRRPRRIYRKIARPSGLMKQPGISRWLSAGIIPSMG